MITRLYCMQMQKRKRKLEKLRQVLCFGGEFLPYKCAWASLDHLLLQSDEPLYPKDLANTFKMLATVSVCRCRASQQLLELPIWIPVCSRAPVKSPITMYCTASACRFSSLSARMAMTILPIDPEADNLSISI